jgi:hypothetical protein
MSALKPLASAHKHIIFWLAMILAVKSDCFLNNIQRLTFLTEEKYIL